MNDPLYGMKPGDPDWDYELAEEVENLHTALVQDDQERIARKIAELRHAFDLLDRYSSSSTSSKGQSP